MPRDLQGKRREPNKRLLNNLLIERLEPKDQPYLIWDTKQDRLAIRVEPSGHCSYKVIYSRHGRPRWYNIGKVNAVDLAAARKLAGKIMTRVADGEDPQADRKAERNQGTFEELAKSYVEQYAKKKNKSWKQADDLVKKHLIPKWGKLKAADISRSEVKTRISKIEAKIVANQVLASASAIFSWAIKEELAGIKINPCAKIDRNETKTAKSDRILSDSEIPKFWTAFNDVGLVEGLALKMILLTGQRPGEIRHMRTEHLTPVIDPNDLLPNDCWWNMPGAPVTKLNWPGTKNAQSHSVFLPKPAQQIIKDMGSTGMVFTGSRGKAITGLDEAMRTICEQLNMARATPHDLRRTHSSAVAKLFGRDAMNRITNHKEGGISDIYDAAEYADENQKIMETVATKLLSLIEGVIDANVVAFRKA
jgi:integrase